MNPGEVIADRFEIVKRARSGGMAALYQAHDRFDGGVVALKVLERLGVANETRFVREAQVLAELSHPGLVRYVSHGSTGRGVPYLVMEWLEGCDLAERLARGPLSVGEAVELVRRAAEALAVAHARGVIHRDLKPANLFLVDGRVERVKVVDFGIARQAHLNSATVTGHAVGTPRYMAPEQVRGQRDLDARVDVYGLGGLLFAAVSRRAPFDGHDAMAVLAKVLLEDPVRLDELAPVPVALADLVANLLAKDREDRPADAAAVAVALAGVETDVPDAPAVPPPAAITGGEQRLLSLVLLEADAATLTTTGQPTAATQTSLLSTDELVAVVTRHRGRLETLVDGTVIVTLTGTGSATDQTVQAARCAMALAAVAPGRAIAVATGRGQVARRQPVGEVIDRAAVLLRTARERPEPAVVVDEITAELLAERFEVSVDEAARTLIGEREPAAARTLMGRVTACVGRDAELAALGAVWDECASESTARAVLVTGPAGIGKSRLRYELLRRVAQDVRPHQVWIGRGDPLRAGAPFGLLIPTLRDAAGILDGEPPALQRDKLRARVARHVAADERARITEFLGELIGVPFAAEDNLHLHTARHDPPLMAEQMKAAWNDWVAAEAKATPILIVLEDLHWGDWPTANLIDSLLTNLVDYPIMVLALARPEVKEVLPGLWAGRPVTEIALGHLTRRASQRLVRAVLGADTDNAVVERVVTLAAGNALHLEELIRSVAAGKGEELPGTVLAMMQARLDRLPAEARRVLRAASVFGNLFWSGGVASLLGGDADRLGLDEWLRFLVQEEVVSRRGDRKFPDEDALVFRHALVREAAYSLLTDDDRRLGHRLAGGWLEAAGESDPVVLAEHHERGGQPARAATFYRRASELALEAADLAVAVSLARRALACLDQAGEPAGPDGCDEVRGQLHLLCAQAHGWLGQYAEQDAAAQAALTALPVAEGAWCRAVAAAGAARAMLGDQDGLLSLGGALADAGADRPVIDRAYVLAAAATAAHLLFGGHYPLAERLLDLIEPVAPGFADRDPAVTAAVLRVHGVRSICAGDLAASLVNKKGSVEAYERAGDRPGAYMQRGNLGSVYIGLGAYAEAEALLREAAAGADQLGLASVAGLCRANLGTALVHLDRVTEALAVEETAAAAFESLSERRMEGLARADLAYIRLRAGDHEGARREADRSVELVAEIPPSRAYALGQRARVELTSGDPAAARASAEEAMAILEKLGGLDEGEPLVRLVHAQALDATGDRPAAAAAIASARARIEEVAARIGDQQWRRSFLERVAECRQTLALDRDWNG